MRKKNSNNESAHKPVRNDPPTENDFYAAVPSEQPLNTDRSQAGRQRIRKTTRHQGDAGRRRERFDPREQKALIGILQMVAIVLVLMMAFYGLYKGISIHEEGLRLEKEAALGIRTIESVQPAEAETIEFDSANLLTALQQRAKSWERAGQSIRSVGALMKRDNRRIAIDRCLDVLEANPYNQQALEWLGKIYSEEEMFEEAADAYLQLLSIHPGNEVVQEQLIEVLNRAEQMDAVVFLSEWYMEQHPYDENVQRYMADALKLLDRHEEAVRAYERVLRDNPEDMEARRSLVGSYIVLEEYEKALQGLNNLDSVDFRNAKHHRNLIICNAQLGNSRETVQSLGRAAHLFGQQTVLVWIQDPRLDPVRQDRTFQAFADRVGGEEFRKWLERVAEAVEEEDRETMMPQLDVPDKIGQDELLLKPRQ